MNERLIFEMKNLTVVTEGSRASNVLSFISLPKHDIYIKRLDNSEREREFVTEKLVSGH